MIVGLGHCAFCHRMIAVNECEATICIECRKRHPEDAQFESLVATAKQEGRVGGQWRCRFCGMRYHYREGAEDCCSALALPEDVL
jgi:hypothetical protein